MGAPQYNMTTSGAVALSAATPKTILGVKAHANSGLLLLKYSVSFDGVTASAVPVEVELGYCTWATNPPGTNSGAVNVNQTNGRVLTAGFIAGRAWTAEPTTITQLTSDLLTPNGGMVIYDFPLGNEYDSGLAEGFIIRCTAPATVNVRGVFKCSRC